MARATALPLLMPYASPASEPAIKGAIADPDPLVREAAPRALPGTPPPRLVDAAAPLLSDPVRSVRIEAARALAGTDLLALSPEQQTALVRATAELVAAEMVDADRPEAHLNLGLLDLRRRELSGAEAEYRNDAILLREAGVSLDRALPAAGADPAPQAARGLRIVGSGWPRLHDGQPANREARKSGPRRSARARPTAA